MLLKARGNEEIGILMSSSFFTAIPEAERKWNKSEGNYFSYIQPNYQVLKLKTFSDIYWSKTLTFLGKLLEKLHQTKKVYQKR